MTGKRYEVRLSGTGGQGVVLAGILLAEAASISGGQYVAQTVRYGPQVRGGMSSAQIVVSKQEIDYPLPLALDLFVPFTQEACDEGAGMMKPGGLILLDPVQVAQRPEGWVAPIELGRLARESSGTDRMANMVALGAIVSLAPMVTPASAECALKERIPADSLERFILALRAGVEAGTRARNHIVFEEAPSPED